MEILSKVLDPVINAVMGPILRNIAYPFKVSGNVNALDSANQNLVAVRDDVKHRVQIAELQGMTQTEQVGNWSRRVEKINEEVEKIKRRYADRSRCLGIQFFNCWSNYRISKDATKKLMEMQELQGQGDKFNEVAIQLPLEAPEFDVGSEVVPKEEADLQKLTRYIESDQSRIVGIYGMGGVGKTHLLHLVHNQYKRNSSFEAVFFLTASREYSVEKIQTELRQKYSLGQGEGVVSNAQIISNYLKHHSFLILLDDVWGKIDFQRIGIPISLLGDKKKIVITTRSESVCSLNGINPKHLIKVVCLDTQDALDLFQKNVGEGTIKSNSRIQSLAVEVVKELDGLPLALVIIGRSMYGKRDPREWEYALDLLRRSRLNEIEITREEEKTFYQLKFSYDSLESSELRDFFCACSLWPEDYLINKVNLIEVCMGLELLPAFGEQNIYNSGYSFIGKLLSACLLEEVGTDFVKMHDVIRDMALWLANDCGKAREKWIVRTEDEIDQVLQETNLWSHVERVTLLIHNRDLAVELKPIPCQANKLQFLNITDMSLLSTVKTVVKNLKFFTALTFLDLSNCRLSSIPQDISNLENLIYLNLFTNWIGCVPEELKLLRNLKYLFLGGNPIYSFPEGIISELKELITLNLYVFGDENMTWLIKEIGCLSNIRSLEIKLYHATYFQNLLELPNLPIRSLELDFVSESDTYLIPSSFIGNRRIQNTLDRLAIQIASIRKIVFESDPKKSHCALRYLESLQLMAMEMLEEVIWQNVAPRALFPALKNVEIYACGELKDVSWTLYLPCLEKLHVESCGNIIRLIENFVLASATEERVILRPFPSLKVLYLDDLPNLQIICHNSVMFPSLEQIRIDDCPMLKRLPFQSNTVPEKLTTIATSRRWWQQLEWEDDDLKQALQPLVQYWPPVI